MLYNSTIKKIKNHSAVVGVVGLGYVGLPFAVEKGKVGFSVIGFDLDTEKVNQINKGKNYIPDVKDDELSNLVKIKRIKATTNFNELSINELYEIIHNSLITNNVTEAWQAIIRIIEKDV